MEQCQKRAKWASERAKREHDRKERIDDNRVHEGQSDIDEFVVAAKLIVNEDTTSHAV